MGGPIVLIGFTDISDPVSMTKFVLVLVIVASISVGIALDRASWRHRKQLWQLQGGAIGLVAGYLLGRSKLV